MLARSLSILNLPSLAVAGVLAASATLVAAADAPPAAPAATVAATPAPEVGTAAPSFKLQDQTGKWVTLDEQRGKWVVLYFYPKDQTPGCTTQACEFRDDVFSFRKANAVILGVSVDDVVSHKEFSEKHGLPFSILADSTKETAKKYGVLTSFGPNVIARRDTFLIDPQGKIVRHYEKVDPKGHSKIVLTDIDSLKASGKKG